MALRADARIDRIPTPQGRVSAAEALRRQKLPYLICDGFCRLELKKTLFAPAEDAEELRDVLYTEQNGHCFACGDWRPVGDFRVVRVVVPA